MSNDSQEQDIPCIVPKIPAIPTKTPAEISHFSPTCVVSFPLFRPRADGRLQEHASQKLARLVNWSTKKCEWPNSSVQMEFFPKFSSHCNHKFKTPSNPVDDPFLARGSPFENTLTRTHLRSPIHMPNLVGRRFYFLLDGPKSASTAF